MIRTLPATLAATALALSAAAFAAPATEDGSGRPLRTTLSGAAEVPGPGDADGAGTFSARINPGKGELCYELTATMIAPATAAHIHRGAAGTAGPVVIGLQAPTDGSSEACVTVTRELAMALIQTPQAFYVNVHNTVHPAGAVRGQLAK